MTYLRKHQKTGVWYFRRTIPEPIRPIIGRGTDWNESLRTKDYDEAKERAKIVGVRVDTALREARRKLAEAQAAEGIEPPPPPDFIVEDGVEWMRNFAAMVNPPEVPAPVYDEVTLADAKVMAGAWVRERLVEHEEQVATQGVPHPPQFGPVPAPTFQGLWISVGDIEGYRLRVARRLNCPVVPLSVADQIANPNHTALQVEMAVWRVAGRFGLVLDPDGESWKRLRYSILLGEQTLTTERERINAGGGGLVVEPTGYPVPQSVLAAPRPEPKPEPAGPTVREAWDSYIMREKPTTKTAGEFARGWEIFFEGFPDFTWDSPLSTIGKSHVRAFRDLLQKLPTHYSLKKEYRGKTVLEIVAMVGNDPRVDRQKSQTVNKYLSALRVVFNHAISEFDLTANPVSLLSVNVDDSEGGVPLSTDELVRVFGDERFTRGQWNADYWIPVLGLYTGARLNEIGQLYLDDVREERGVNYLDLNDSTPDKSLKNEESARRVPIHPQLVKLGFLEFVQAQRAAGHVRLFPELEYSEDQGYTKGFSRDFSRFKNKVEIKGGGKKFHSFRHNWKDAAREADIRQEIYDTIQGHSGSKNVGSSYGNGFSLSVLAEAMAKIEFPGVVIPRVKPRKS